MKNVNTAYEIVDLLSVRPHPKNVRKGDLEQIGQSIAANGFYGALVCQKSTRYILCGSHRMHVLFTKGVKQVPVIWVDVDDETALRIMLADNRINEVASIDLEKLGFLLEQAAKAEPTLTGTGFTREDLDYIVQQAGAGPAIPSGTLDVVITLYDETERDQLFNKLHAEGYHVEKEEAAG